MTVLSTEAVNCYTDGSRMDGRLGAAYHIQTHGCPDATRTLHLGSYSTVPQAEVFALISAAKALLAQPREKEINIYVDSLGTLQSLQPGLKTGLAAECVEALNRLSEDRKVSVHWIPAHSGYDGNELVNLAAKRGTELLPEGPEPYLPVSSKLVHGAIQEWGRRINMRR